MVKWADTELGDKETKREREREGERERERVKRIVITFNTTHIAYHSVAYYICKVGIINGNTQVLLPVLPSLLRTFLAVGRPKESGNGFL
jgi:hypothetical protein